MQRLSKAVVTLRRFPTCGTAVHNAAHWMRTTTTPAYFATPVFANARCNHTIRLDVCIQTSYPGLFVYQVSSQGGAEGNGQVRGIFWMQE